MKYLIVLFASCLVAAQAFNVRVPIPAGGRVIQGESAVNGQFPHMAYLSVGCGGSLIHEKWVLTAAHCIGSGSIRVSMGDVDLSKSPVVVMSSKQYKHPAYKYPDNDIALVELDQPVTFSDNVRPIRIASSTEDLFVGETATLSGFGYINDNFVSPDVLQYVDLTVISNEECKEYFHIFVINSTICINGIKSPAQGSCFGDSGSALILSRPDGDIQIGVTSYIGWEGCEGHNPSAFVRPNFVRDWIRETTGEDL